MDDATIIVASMGASAVLLFAVPHGSLSQPWALGCGQIVSAFIGVSCYLFISNIYLSAATAVGLSITSMYYLRCIHPPGGATALSAVMAGPSVHALAYYYVVTPVLINITVIFSVAIIYNYLFSWRRYPAMLIHYVGTHSHLDKPGIEELQKSQSNYTLNENALKEIDTYIDVSIEDLMMIMKTAEKYAQLRRVEKILVHHIMTGDVVTIDQDTSMQEAAKILLERRISGLPIVDTNARLVGIVTEADFLTALGIPCHHPAHSLWQSLESMFNSRPRNSTIPMKVADIMSTQTVCIRRENNLHEVIHTMKHHHVKRLVVVDDNQHVEGIITRSNLVKLLLQQILY